MDCFNISFFSKSNIPYDEVLHMKKYVLRFWPLYVFVASIFLLVLSIGNQAVTVISNNQPIVRTLIPIVISVKLSHFANA